MESQKSGEGFVSCKFASFYPKPLLRSMEIKVEQIFRLLSLTCTSSNLLADLTQDVEGHMESPGIVCYHLHTCVKRTVSHYFQDEHIQQQTTDLPIEHTK
jgi:hypothetical protein